MAPAALSTETSFSPLANVRYRHTLSFMSAPSESPILSPYSSLSLALRTCGRQRAVVEAWLRWWHEISSTPYAVSEPSVAERKLSWWAKAITMAFEIPPQHPLLRAVAPGNGKLTSPPIDLWLSQVQAMTQLCAQTRWLDEAALSQHIEASTGAACQSVAWLMGARSDNALEAAKAFGQGLRRAHILARLGLDARQGWLHIPVDVLQRHDVKAHEILRPASAPHSAAMLGLLQAWKDQAHAGLSDAMAQAQQVPRAERRALKPLVVLCELNKQLLNDLQAQGYPMLTQRLTVGPWRKLWISRRTAWTWW